MLAVYSSNWSLWHNLDIGRGLADVADESLAMCWALLRLLIGRDPAGAAIASDLDGVLLAHQPVFFLRLSWSLLDSRRALL